MRGRRALRAVAAVGVVVALAGCSDDEPDKASDRTDLDEPESITVTSSAFGEGDAIPATYSCDGDELAPPLAWTGVPDDAAALALVVDDPDAPSGPFTHWAVVDIPGEVTSSDEGGVPRGGVEVENSSGETSYAGPCPPSGTHRYRFTVYALSAETGLDGAASLEEALDAIEEHTVAWGRLTGTFER